MRLLPPLASLAVCACLTAGGCGGPSSDPSSASPTATATLEEFGSMLKMIAEQKKKVPANLAELDTYEPLYMSACRGVSSKQIVYVWGQGYAPGDTDVVAYEPDAETKGGMVLLQDGTVKPMTAAEFKSATKAGKK